jgi:hypothetical protein
MEKDKGRYVRLTCAACSTVAALHLVYLEYRDVVAGADHSQAHLEQWQQGLGPLSFDETDLPRPMQHTALPPFPRPMAHWSIQQGMPIYLMQAGDELAFAA